LTKLDDYLKRYAEKYRAAKAADGIWQIQTAHRPRNGLTFDVYDYSDTHLAVLLPPLSARNLLQKHPGVFAIHQDAEDAIVLLFEESHLRELADVLKLRCRRKLSESHKNKLVESSAQYRFGFASRSEKVV